jgi:hypothetical protein
MGTATRAEVIEVARSWLGTRWRHQGRRKGWGVDCVGLIIGVARELCLPASDFDTTNYSPIPDGVRLRAQCDQLLIPVADRSPLPSDIALMSFGGAPQHLGFISELDGSQGLIHAYVIERRVVEHSIDEIWRGRFVALYALPGVS